jgi:archaellum component FlaF (FlaF/FlaG flagellin family)
VDIDAVKTFYGQYVNLNQASSESFKDLVNAVWDLKVQGATEYNVSKFLGTLTNTDIVDADGTVVAVWTEAARRMVGVSTLNSNTIDRVYSAPSAAVESVAVDDTVAIGQNIFNTFTTYKGSAALPAATIPNLYMSRGMLGGAYRAGLCFPNATLPVTFEYWPTDSSLTILSETGDQILYRNNDTQQIALVTADTDAMTAAGIVNIPIFYIGGEVTDVVKFKYSMAYNAWRNDIDLFDKITTGQVGPAYTINPCGFIQSDVLRTNMVFISINMDLFDPVINAQAAMRYLSNTVPAGTTFLIFMSKECNLDTYGTADVVETLAVSHTFLLNDSFSDVSDNLRASIRVG